MDYYETLTLVVSILAVAVSAFAALFTYKNLKEIRNQFFEQNRGNIVFYIDTIKSGTFHRLIIKNFGNSPAKLLSLSISPDIDWAKANSTLSSKFNVSNFKNIFLAPNQHVSSEFNFKGYPDEVFKVEIKYETCGKTILESYSVDLHFFHTALSGAKKIDDELSALKEINNSIQQLSRRFL